MAEARPDFFPDTTVDGLLGAAAASGPKRTGVRASYGDLTFADLDDAATSCAAALRGLLGEQRCVVALASPLHPDFVTGFYGTIRSGNVVAPINPLLPEHALEHLLLTSRARLAFVTTELFAHLRRIRHRLPDLAEAVLVGPGPREDANDIRTIDDLSAAYEVRGNRMARPATDPSDVACLQFTSGTTGAPRGVLLTHRNLVANAEQVVRAHRLGPDSVVLNHLPKYHVMHLNSAVRAQALQVPCAAADQAEAFALANDSRATHLYTIPMRLNRLDTDPALGGLRLDTVRMIASGGTALAAPVAERLSARFGIPVFQGYGLAETSPLTHSAGPDDPRPGTVGPVVAGTECRIVDLATGRALPPGRRGEVHVRGPQVMRGYLDPAEPSGIDAEGWLATGDVGYEDDDGVLHLVDRLKDFFKTDNYLVSPSEVEAVLERHPAVLESAVVGYPDPLSGHVVTAFAAVAEDRRREPGLAADITAFVAARVPYYQRVRHLELVTALPRSPNGKVRRRDLLAELITRRELTGKQTTGGNPAMTDDTPDLSNLIAVVTRFRTSGDPEEFEKFFLEHVEYMRAQEGFGSHQAVRLVDNPSVYVNFGWWLSQEAFRKVTASEEFRAHQATMRSMLEGAEIDLCKNLFRVNAGETAGERGEFDTPLMTVMTFRATASAEEFETAFAAYAKDIRGRHGFGYADLNRSLQRPGTYLGIGYWWRPQVLAEVTASEPYRALAELADITVEEVTHVAWNRAIGADGETAGATAGSGR
ncbi:AMP-binding protein [Saccharothrix australiensis]|uniref:Long-chain acyl-CoA synthetase n=1 Tax=Saccharothrix australiensis TaxID=2072 RepID=A0A495W725_9PSEU|nr:AMP-binding protein [Saccharothrix australiensis]RKT55608.1 long-chain acyl-CoA synthetase [Saccharothrix australiensis]